MSYQTKIKKHIVAEPYPLPKTKKDSGIKTAQVGAALGARFGPYGVLVGGVTGFLLGIAVDELLDD